MAYEELIENGKATQFKSGEEAAKNGAKGGVASGIARRRKRTLKQAVDLAMSLPVSEKKSKEKLAEMGIADEDADNQMAVVVGLMLKAMSGNPFEHLEDENESAAGQTESHNALIEAIRMRNNED